MNKKILLLALLASLTFLLTYLLMEGSLGLETRQARAPGSLQLPQGEEVSGRITPQGRNFGPHTAPKANLKREPGKAPPPGQGTLLARIQDQEGNGLAAFSMDLRPFTGRVTSNTDGLLEVQGVQEGPHVLSVWAEGFLRQDVPRIVIHAGRKTRLVVTLKKGIRPAGLVVDEKTHYPVEGVVVEFYKGGRCITDKLGHFQSPYALSPLSITSITVSHKDYDRFTYYRLPIKDVNHIVLAMSRGDSVLNLKISNKSRRSLPPWYRIQLWMERGGNIPPEIRKEITLRPASHVRLKGIHKGTYHLLLRFPDTNLASRQRNLKVLYHETHTMEFAFDSGITLHGHLVSRAPGSKAIKVELISLAGMTLATVYSAPDGRFTIEGVEAGTYRVRVWRGSPVTDFSHLKVGQTDLFVTFDLDRFTLRIGSLKKH